MMSKPEEEAYEVELFGRKFQARSSGNPKPFGKIGFGLSILGFLISLIPFVGVAGGGIGFISLIFCGIAYIHALRTPPPQKYLLIGIVLSVIAIGMAIFWRIYFHEIFDGISKIRKAYQDKMLEIFIGVLKDRLGW